MSPKKKTTEDFIREAKAIHGDKYDYSQSKYLGAKTKIKIICKLHDKFLQTPDDHLHKKGCPECGGTKKKTTDEFIKKAIKAHGIKYDYSKVIYKNNIEKITIICPIHGEFLQKPANHTNINNGCPDCAGVGKLNQSKFIKKAIDEHGDKYDYSITKYIKHSSMIEINCYEHGVFTQTANNHLSGHGCPKCGYKDMTDKSKLTKEEFIEKANMTHDYFYDYSEVKYINAKTKIKIKCPIHKTFEQEPYSHLIGRGCPKCINKAEGRIAEYLIGSNITYREYSINKKRYDFFIPKLNLLIERDGEQHYRNQQIGKVKLFVSEQQKNDKYKTRLAINKGFKIARIPYWLSKKEEEIEIENILAGKPTYPDVPDLKQEKTKPKPVKNF